VGDVEKRDVVAVVVRSDSHDLVSVGSSAGVEHTDITGVTSRDSARDTLLDDARDSDSPGLLRPTAGTADRSSDDVSAILVSLVESGDENIVTGFSRASEDTVGAESDSGSSTGETVLVLLGSNNTSDVRTVALAIHGIVIRVNGVETIILITDEISTEGNKAIFTEATAKSRMLIIDLLMSASV
jgi:hypothetical protein